MSPNYETSKGLFYLLMAITMNIVAVLSLGLLGMVAYNTKKWIEFGTQDASAHINEAIKAWGIAGSASWIPVVCILASNDEVNHPGRAQNDNYRLISALTAFVLFSTVGIVLGCFLIQSRKDKFNFLPVLYFAIPAAAILLSYCSRILKRAVNTPTPTQQPPMMVVVTQHEPFDEPNTNQPSPTH